MGRNVDSESFKEGVHDALSDKDAPTSHTIPDPVGLVASIISPDYAKEKTEEIKDYKAGREFGESLKKER